MSQEKLTPNLEFSDQHFNHLRREYQRILETLNDYVNLEYLQLFIAEMGYVGENLSVEYILTNVFKPQKFTKLTHLNLRILNYF